VSENHPLNPLSPYAESKLAIERLLGFLWQSNHIPFAILRYFNVCGIDRATDNKDGHSVHLIPYLVKTFQEESIKVKIFGVDYSTSDGTCIRDYVHVTDVAYANLKALEYILSEKKPIVANIGTEKGYSVRQIAESVSKHAKKKYTEICLPRREGDIPMVVADNGCAKQNFDWSPQNSSLDDIVGSYYGK
jgi:UDP-glucose 4-epimerase